MNVSVCCFKADEIGSYLYYSYQFVAKNIILALKVLCCSLKIFFRNENVVEK